MLADVAVVSWMLACYYALLVVVVADLLTRRPAR